jgi:hypothetical protein
VKLHVELQEGWSGEPVEVIVDGQPAYRGNPTTRMQTGFAAGVEVDVPAGGEPVVVEIQVPQRDIVTRHQIGAGPEIWVGLTLRDGQVRVREQPAPFGYV